MKKQMFGWAVVIAVLGMAIMATSAVAAPFYSANGNGDVLLFPYFDADKENIVCISNEGNNWIQIHVRLRTAARSVEGRDFPLILSPGDMVVFNVTRNGYDDDMWRVEQNLDPNNFRYVRINSTPRTCLSTIEIKNEYLRLEPKPVDTYWNRASKDLDEKHGYIEVFAEAIFDQGLSKVDMLVNGNCQNTWNYIKTPGNTLSDVPNVLTGKMYIMDTLQGSGVAYNATAIANFRTNTPVGFHRVENYVNAVTNIPINGQTGVILVSENSAVNNATLRTDGNLDDYTYSYYEDGQRGTPGGIYESMVSANNTWGPTLADGDVNLDAVGFSDFLDDTFGVITSVREVEAAIRRNSIRGHYFNETNFTTHLIITLPTKHHVMMNPIIWAPVFAATAASWNNWLVAHTNYEARLMPNYAPAIWDIDENTEISTPFDISPLPPIVVENLLPWELNVLTPAVGSRYTSGRFILSGFGDAGVGQLLVINGTLPCIAQTFIEMSGDMTGYMTECQY